MNGSSTVLDRKKPYEEHHGMLSAIRNVYTTIHSGMLCICTAKWMAKQLRLLLLKWPSRLANQCAYEGYRKALTLLCGNVECDSPGKLCQLSFSATDDFLCVLIWNIEFV